MDACIGIRPEGSPHGNGHMRACALAALPLPLTGMLSRPAQADQFACMDLRQATDAMQAIGQ